MANNCAVCGANLDMVGRIHRCIPKPAGASVAAAVPVDPGARQSTYLYRNPDQRREYMRDLMRKRRERH